MGKGGVGKVAEIERTGGYYEVQEVEFGLIYRWCPERFAVECDCGERLVITDGSEAACECGADHTSAVRGERTAGRPGDEALHPWRYAGDRESVGLPC